jgi:hypothetical protein
MSFSRCSECIGPHQVAFFWHPILRAESVNVCGSSASYEFEDPFLYFQFHLVSPHFWINVADGGLSCASQGENRRLRQAVLGPTHGGSCRLLMGHISQRGHKWRGQPSCLQSCKTSVPYLLSVQSSWFVIFICLPQSHKQTQLKHFLYPFDLINWQPPLPLHFSWIFWGGSWPPIPTQWLRSHWEKVWKGQTSRAFHLSPAHVLQM